MTPEMMSIVWNILAVAGLVGLNGFFVATEFALVSVRRTRIEELVVGGKAAAFSVQAALHDLDRYIAATQVGITIASLALGWIGEPALSILFHPVIDWVPFLESPGLRHGIAAGLAFALITFLHVVVGELVPKSMALQRPEAIALFVGRPMALAVLVFRPIIAVLNGFGNWILKLTGFEPAGELHSVHSADELAILVRQSHEAGVLDEAEVKILQRTFGFSEIVSSDVMIPRPDIESVDADAPSQEVVARLLESPRSRLLAYERDLDHPIGILHVHDVLKHVLGGKGPLDVRKLVRPALFVPDSVHLDDLLEHFRRARTHIAVVVDEFGGTAGLVTLEDVVEEVFGDLEDEIEAEQPDVQLHPDGRIIVRGDVRLDDLKEETGWNLSDEDVDTIGGFVMNRLGRVARVGDVVEVPEGGIQVINMARTRITQVALRPAAPPPESGQSPASNS